MISEGEGPVGTVLWRGRFAAWTNRRGVRVYDVVEGRVVALVKCPGDHEFRQGWEQDFP